MVTEHSPAKEEGGMFRPERRPRTFACPHCGGSVTLKAAGHTVSAVCGFCSSLIDVANENFRIIQASKEKTRLTLLEIGQRGKLQGVEWEVTGYMQKTDGSSLYKWDEYLLFNPYEGYRFLSQMDRHWTIFSLLKKGVDIEAQKYARKLEFEDRMYSLFLTGEAVVAYVKGEFYWRVKKGDRTKVEDYIAPPYMLSIERSKGEINASLGEYIEPKEVFSAFGVKGGRVKRFGVAANQPNPYQHKKDGLFLVTKVALAAVFLVQIITVFGSQNVEVFRRHLQLRANQTGQTMIGQDLIEIPQMTNVMIESYAPVENRWAEISYALVNQSTQEEYAFLQPIEYYYGYTGGEHWREGSQVTQSYISSVSEGMYRLEMEVETDVFNSSPSVPLALSVVIKRSVPVWINFWAALLLIGIYPLFVLMRSWSFESKRWAESDYAPILYKKDD